MKFTANGDVREFTARKVFRLRDEATLIRLMERTGGDLARFGAVVLEDEATTREFCEAVFIGDHTGFSWYDVEERAEWGEAVEEALGFFYGTAKPKPPASQASRKGSSQKS